MADLSHLINAERLSVLSWGRAILLQLAHPLIAAGVADHSAVGSDPRAAAGRLRHTIRAMLALTFGDEQACLHAIGHIKAVHRRVNGHLREAVGPYPKGAYYSAESPDLLLWVHATLIESMVLIYDDLVAPLNATARDTYCRQARRVTIALGAKDEDVPDTWNGLVTWLNTTRRSGAIVIGPDARRVAAVVLDPPMASLVWPMASVNKTMTVGTLPDDIRSGYGLEWTPADARRLARTRRLLRAARRRTPQAIAWWSVARQRA